jgi:hypothetical protein
MFITLPTVPPPPFNPHIFRLVQHPLLERMEHGAPEACPIIFHWRALLIMLTCHVSIPRFDFDKYFMPSI